MLTQLDIQGLAIIDSLSIEFTPGFNVITGETGAGKSILIKALGLLLGAKGSAETVRRGRESASVTGIFEVSTRHRCVEVLEHYEIPFNRKGSSFDLLIRRTVHHKGRSLAWINDIPVTIVVLRELAASLIDVFGQHENLRLLDVAHHTAYVDRFVKDQNLLAHYARTFDATQQLLHRVIEVARDFRSKQRDADYLAFRCEELRKFDPSRDDYVAVEALSRKGGNVLSLVSGLEQAQVCLDQGAGGEPLSRPLREMIRIFAKLETLSPELKPLAEVADSVATQLDELSYGVGKALSGMEVDEGDLEAAQSRLAGYQDLFRKMAVHDVDELVAAWGRLESELGFLDSAKADMTELLTELARHGEALEQAASKLSKARAKAKALVCERIEVELHELAMPGATIDIEFSPVSRSLPEADLAVFGEEIAQRWSEITERLATLGEHGAERAQFLLSANPGEALLPLQKIASGGEISRIMLALKKALAAGADTCILVFDEIDTGISGRVADVVGRKMQELARNFQVICISHLAQVAAYAETHFLVHKFGRGQRTESTITRLSLKESEEEIARLVSGQEVTPSSLANARALMRKARSPKSARASVEA